MMLDLKKEGVARNCDFLEQDLTKCSRVLVSLNALRQSFFGDEARQKLSQAREALSIGNLEKANLEVETGLKQVNDVVADQVQTYRAKIEEFAAEHSLVNLDLCVPSKDDVSSLHSHFSGSARAKFNSGVACAIGLIPEDKVLLTFLGFNQFSTRAVSIVEQELINGIESLVPDSSTCWHLAANGIMDSVTNKDNFTQLDFLDAISRFKEMAEDPISRLAAAKAHFENLMQQAKELLPKSNIYSTQSLPKILEASLVALDCHNAAKAYVLPVILNHVISPVELKLVQIGT